MRTHADRHIHKAHNLRMEEVESSESADFAVLPFDKYQTLCRVSDATQSIQATDNIYFLMQSSLFLIEQRT